LSSIERDDTTLWEDFNASAIPEKEWTHREHLRIGWMFLTKHPLLDEAHILMRVGIIRLNGFHKLVETPSRGYHETLTRVWLLLIRGLMKEVDDAATSAAFVDQCGARLSRDAVLKHYSRDKIMSVRARSIFVDPDLEPFPPE
jgi:hypothetical protein